MIRTSDGYIEFSGLLTCGDGGAHGGEDEEEGGDELGEIGAEGGRRKALLEVSSEVRSHFSRRSTFGRS